MYNTNGVVESIKEMLKLIAPIIGLFALVALISAVKDYGLSFIDEGGNEIGNFLDDCLDKM
jgi:hypothetical protein